MDIRIIPSRPNVRIGDDIDLTCEVSGQAPASVTWRRMNSGLPLNAQPRENVLRLINVQANYGGIYQCVVTTSTGVFEENFPLAIQGKFHFLFLHFSFHDADAICKLKFTESTYRSELLRDH